LVTHEEYKEMLIAHALTALEESEAGALEAHLQTCADCHQEMDHWRESAALLALEARPLDPPPQLRPRILQDKEKASDLEKKTESLNADRTATSNVIELSRVPRRTWASVQTWGPIAAALVFVALILSLAVLWKQNNTAKQELDRLSNQIHENEQLLAREREAIAILTTPGARMAELSGTNVAPSAHAMLAYDKSGRYVLMAKGLPLAPIGQAYQLWFIAGGQPIPGKVFSATASGDGTLNDQIPSVALNNAVFAITLEPESGVRAPTGAIYLRSGS
jgi:anti-sigma-K factor RskA